MKIVIITRGRVGGLHTPYSIPPERIPDTYIMCPQDEVDAHRRNHPMFRVISEGPETMDYGTKFNKIVMGGYPELGRRILIMDDDLRFSMRDPNSDSLIKANASGLWDGFNRIEDIMEEYPLCGFHPRAMGNNSPNGIKECTRISNVQGLNLDLIGDVDTGDWPILNDMVLNLRLLTRGQKTAVWCELFWDQVGSNTKGGCSIHRTAEQQDKYVRRMAAEFPGLVTVQVKTPKNGGGFWTNRTDFRIAWQKAYRQGVDYASRQSNA